MNTTETLSSGWIRSEFANEPDFQELLEMFVGSASEKQREASDLLAVNDFASLKVLAHQLKGSAGGYGFRGLSHEAEQLEAACKANDTERIHIATAEMIAYLGRLAL